MTIQHSFLFFFFFNDTATTEIYTLSLHDALPISRRSRRVWVAAGSCGHPGKAGPAAVPGGSEEHTAELQSPCNIVLRLLLEKKKKNEVMHDDGRVNVEQLSSIAISREHVRL